MSVPSAMAAPKTKAAKAAFDRGVVAYQKGDFEGASTALGESYKLEPDIETLFAWAQSERQQEKCESAIELYKKLLASADMPTENKAAVQATLDECKAIIAAKKPVEPPPPLKEEEKVPTKVDQPEPKPNGPTPWWKDPIGDALTGAGIVSLGVGTYFLLSARSAENKSQENIANFESEQDKAESHGKIGVIASALGGALIVGGIVRYMTRSNGTEESSTVSGWITPDGAGGIAAFGRF